jgi:hypothetical protein
MQTSTTQLSTRQTATPQYSAMLASTESQNFNVSTPKRQEHRNGGETGIGARSMGASQIDSISDDQFLKMSISPKVEKLPIAVCKSSDFFK